MPRDPLKIKCLSYSKKYKCCSCGKWARVVNETEKFCLNCYKDLVCPKTEILFSQTANIRICRLKRRTSLVTVKEEDQSFENAIKLLENFSSTAE